MTTTSSIPIHATDVLINPFYMGDYDMLANDKTGVNTGFIGAFEDIAECAAIARDFRPEPITARPSNAGRVSLTPEQMLAAHQDLQALMEARALLG